MNATTVWSTGRFDAKATRTSRLLFGQMYEDPEVERAAFPPGGRIFVIASAGCTALALADRHDVVACDINAAQLAYAERRTSGGPREVGSAERLLTFARWLMPLAGWRRGTISEFLALRDPAAQATFFRQRLDTWQFRIGFDAMLSGLGLRAVYAPAYLSFLPKRFGAVLRRRLERGLSRHPNADNPYARALLRGDPIEPGFSGGRRPQFVHSDAATYLEQAPRGHLSGFTLSNILDGATEAYRDRLLTAVRRAATSDAALVLRSFAEPPAPSTRNRAESDRSLLWGSVDVCRVSEL